MRTITFFILLLLVFSCFSAESAEYELFKEILGIPLNSSRQSLAVDNDGMLWVCSGGLVFRHDVANWEDFTEISGGAALVSASSDGVMWFADDEHLSRFDGTEWTYFPKDIGLPEYVNAISAGPDNILWLVLYDIPDEPMTIDPAILTIAKFDGEKLVKYREGLLQNHISRITATSDGGVWIVYHNFFDAWDCNGDSCPKGTSYFDGTTFHHFTGENGLPLSELGYTDVRWIVQNPEDGNIYASCNNDLYKYSNGSWSQISSIWSSGMLVNGNNGELWCGYFGLLKGSGLLSLNFNDDEWIDYNASEISSMVFDELEWPFSNTMAVTPDGMIWIGFNVRSGTNGGVLRIDPSTLNSTNVESEKPTAFLNKISSYPNPFNPTTTLTYSIAQQSHVTLNVYSITGRKVATLVGSYMSAGEHSVQFDGTGLASGVYFYWFKSEGFEKTGRMLLVK
ncbi:T9SS type A sorting domain-containing protein [Candidatus Latescibacterota bacterium]